MKFVIVFVAIIALAGALDPKCGLTKYFVDHINEFVPVYNSGIQTMQFILPINCKKTWDEAAALMAKNSTQAAACCKDIETKSIACLTKAVAPPAGKPYSVSTFVGNNTHNIYITTVNFPISLIPKSADGIKKLRDNVKACLAA